MKDLTEHAAFSSQSVNTAYCVYWFLPRCSFADTGLRWTAALRANPAGPVCLDIKKLREVWKTFLTLTGASPLIALCAAMDRNRLRKAVKYCEKKKIYIYVNCTHYVYWLMNILTTGAKEMVVLSIEVTISLSISIWMTLYQFDLFFLIVVKFI